MNADPRVAEDREPIEQLADEFLSRFRDGQRPAISEYEAAHPELAAEIRELFPTLVLLERLGPRPEEVAGGESGGPDAAVPRQLGEYRILREVGRGGMGVVYEAVQETLGRHVALKVLPSHVLQDDVRLKRFQHESQAAARLHHTNIVPVFGVGAEAGVCFYAMQFIQGRGLNEVIDEVRRLKKNRASGSAQPDTSSDSPLRADDTPQAANLSTLSDTPRYYRSVARLGAQVADALEYAHRQGILHRDIKPANLLLDATGTVWVTDFGLAKAEGMEELTQTGDIIGTLRYTAPERMHGEGDARADIYSLGLTLYELLTLRPAFDAADRVSLVRQIAQDDPPRPRKLGSRIPRDLETVVLKAIAKEPARRYATAGELAEDLRRFLGDRPIEARRTPWWEHTWRWCRRNPIVATACSVAVVALVGGLAVSLWQWDRADRNFQQAEFSAAKASASAAEAQAHAEQAERDFRLAFQAVDQMLSRAGYDDLESVPHMEQGRKELLQDAVRFYEALLKGREQRSELQVEMARARRRLGHIHVWLGDYAAAEREQELALGMFQSLLRGDPNNVMFRQFIAESYSTLGVVRAHCAKASQAEADLRQALDQWASLNKAPSTRADYVLAEARVHFWLAEHFRKTSRLEDAEGCMRQSLARLEALESRDPEMPHLRMILADVLVAMAHLVEEPDQDERFLRRALDLLEAESRMQPAPNILIRLASAQSNLAHNLARKRKGDPEAGGFYVRSLKVTEKLVKDFPRALPYQRELAAASDSYGSWLKDKVQLDEAESAHRRAIELWEVQVAANDSATDYRRRLAVAEHNLALVLQARGDIAGAKALWIQAIDHQERVIRSNPQDSEAVDFLTLHDRGLVQILRRTSDPAEAERSLIRRIDFFADLFATEPSAPLTLRGAQVQAHHSLGHFLREVERLDEAAKTYETCIALARRLCDDAPENAHYRSELGGMLNNYGAVLSKQGKYAEVIPLLEEAIGHQQQALAARPGEGTFRRYLQNHHGVLSDALIGQGDHRQAVENIQKARRQSPDLVQEYRAAVKFGSCMALAAKDDHLTEVERKAAVQHYADQAIELLQAAHRKQAKELTALESQAEFAPLRERPDFQELLAAVKNPPK